MYHLAEKKSKLKIKSLKLKNFRNYELLNLEFDGSTNIFYGDNAQGKTNILEAVYLSGTTKSHRGSKDRDMIQFGAEESHIEVIVEKRGIQDQIDMHLKKNRPKGVAINKIPIRKAGELFGIVNLVFFSPEDLNIIKNGPAGRRKFIDLELSQLDKVYFNHLSNYSRIVNQRNHLLKDSAYRQDAMETLDIWDLQLVQYGNAIIARRKQFVDEMNEIVSGIHKKLTGGKEEIRLIYEPSTKNMSLEQALEMNRQRDIRMKSTSVGQRTAALSLKLAEIELVKRVIGDTPVLLLDDVLSELDKHRQNYLLDSIHDIQTLITCTGVDEFVNHRFEVNKVFHVQNGQVIKEN